MSLAYLLSILLLYSYFYTLHIPILDMCSSFMLVICLFNVPILFRLHTMSLVYVFFIFRFYDILHSMYYYIYHFLHIVLSYIFLYDLVLSYTLHLWFHISIFVYCSFHILFSCYTFHMAFSFMYLHMLPYIFI